MVIHPKLIYAANVRSQIRILHPQIKPLIKEKIEDLVDNPFLGKQLERELTSYFSLRANRYRIIYKVNDESNTIEIHYIGHRKDIYELFGDHIKMKE
jgi:mRNA-degrading endonuclease RelE of RelBE toxin-antitoxin system